MNAHASLPPAFPEYHSLVRNGKCSLKSGGTRRLLNPSKPDDAATFKTGDLTSAGTRALIEHIENMSCASRLPLSPGCAVALPGSPLPAGRPARAAAAGWRAGTRSSTPQWEIGRAHV